MAKILLVLTIILTGAAAFFGYTTYTKLGGVQETITKANGDTASAVANLQKAKDEATAAKKDAAAANDKASAAVAADAVDKDAASKAAADLTALKTSTDSQIADLNKTIADQKDQIAKGGGPTTPPVPGANDKELADLKAQLAEAKALNDTLQSKQKDDEAKIETLSKQAAGVAIKKARPGLEGEIMAVNQGWNFVVVSIGDRQGAEANSELIVKRGDTMIGKVKITSVEPSTSIADIIPDSVPKGQRVMPGDRVIFPVQ